MADIYSKLENFFAASFLTVKQLFDEFFHFSGLKPDLNKSLYFFAGVSDEALQNLRGYPPNSCGGSAYKISWCSSNLYQVKGQMVAEFCKIGFWVEYKVGQLKRFVMEAGLS